MTSQRSIKMALEGVSVSYDDRRALEDISIEVPQKTVTALIGPSGSGKSTLLRCFNRMNDTIRGARVTGRVFLDGEDINTPATDPVFLRTRVGMVFQTPNPFRKSVFDNVAYGPRIHGLAKTRAELEPLVETSLRRVGLWNEVADRLDSPATRLSSGQQQRLVIARAIAIRPEVILMDEPCSALDPIATARIEELIDDMREEFCILIVTHSMAQAARISQETIFLNNGRLIEMGPTDRMFMNPGEPETQNYITGRFG